MTAKYKSLGQSFVEVIIALGVAVLVILALVGLTANSVRNADFAKKTAQAAQYAQEGMENLRALRDAGWGNFWNMATPVGQTYGLSSSNPSGSCPLTPNLTGTVFIRCVQMKQAPNSKVEATVTVTWDDPTGTHKSKLVSYFSRW